MSADFTPEKEDLRVLSPFKMQVLTNFPYIEADFDALTNYQLLCKIVEYLNNVITNENEVTEQVTSLYNAYVALQNYVNTYFDNLDLTGEVSAKIDEMAEDGTLTNLIKAYIDPLYQAYETSINLDIANQNLEISSFKNGVTASLANMSNQIVTATSGSPKGVYATVAALESADPSHDYIYVVTADGKWYYYNTSLTAWTAGGTYQATEISDSDPTIAYILDNIDDLQNAKDDTIDTIYYTDQDFKTNNLISDLIWYDGYFTTEDGTRTSTQYTVSYSTSDPFKVESGFTYQVDGIGSVGGQLNGVYFDENMENGTAFALGFVSSTGKKDITIPDGKSYIVFNIAQNGSSHVTKFIRLTQYNSEKDFRLPRLLFNHELYGKKIVNLGDSIFGNNDEDGTGISSYLARYTGATVYNCAFGGTRAGYHPTENWDAFSGYKLATAIATNTWTEQDAAISAAEDFPEYFSTHLATLKSLDFSEIDIVTLSWGTNDFTGGLNPTYNPDAENPQFYYGNTLRNIVLTLESEYPNLKIFIITPFYRFWLEEGVFSDDSNTHEQTSWVGTHTGTLIDFVENAIDAGKAIQTPVINTYYNIGFNEYNRSEYYPNNDGAHQNENGRKLIARYLSKELW